jgi:type VI secretion system protein ImpA
VIDVSELAPDEFLAEIPGENPAGESLPYQIKSELEEARKEINPDDYDENDPTRPSEVKYADWPRIVALASQTLKETSKDLLVAARLTEALTKTRGFGGLADGLAIMRGMVEQCWDRMHPVVDDGDYEVRAGPFNWLADADRGARFPYTVRSAPILSHNGTSIGWRQWKEIQDGKGGLKRDDFDKAVASVSRADCQATVDAVTRVLTELNALAPVLNDKIGRESPGMVDLRSAVGECYTLAKQILDKKPKEEATSEETAGDSGEGGGETGGGGGGGRGGKPMVTRSDIYARLSEAADLLERIEPHSPVPFLIRKAVEFGGLPFPELMKALIRDDSVLTDMNRELGIKPPPEE